MTTARLGHIPPPLYPPIVAAAIVIGAYGGLTVPLDQLWRPVALGLIWTTIVMVCLGVLTRRIHSAGLVATLSALAIVGLWEFALILVGARLFVAWQHIRLHTGLGTTASLTRALNVFATAWLAIAVATAIGAAVSTSTPQVTSLPISAVNGAAPNFYVVLLDGYPRSDTLERYFGYDNAEFLRALTDRGFHVSEDSHSIETTTFLTLPSVFQMKGADVLGLIPYSDSQGERRRVFELVNASPAIATMREAGYTIISIIPGAAPFDLRTADVVIEDTVVTPLEMSLIDGGLFNLFGTEWFYAQRRHVVASAFESLQSIASRSAERRAVFAHVMSPHAPYTFTADGGPARPLPCAPWCDRGTAEIQKLGLSLHDLAGPLVGQVEYVNDRVIETVDAIQAADPDAVIVLYSDHGARLDPADRAEWHRTFFAAHTPGRPAVFGDDPTPTNILSLLLNTYFGTDVPLVPSEPRDESSAGQHTS